jgi:hypothetical protein
VVDVVGLSPTSSASPPWGCLASAIHLGWKEMLPRSVVAGALCRLRPGAQPAAVRGCVSEVALPR